MALFEETQTKNEFENASLSTEQNQNQSSDDSSETVRAQSTPASQSSDQPKHHMSEDFATSLETFTTEA